MNKCIVCNQVTELFYDKKCAKCGKDVIVCDECAVNQDKFFCVGCEVFLVKPE
ncbi:MAG: hypothetical protein KAS70_02915 [Planctomycetes bacterium]|nr:hypothetical protein [Planctomycetota bacterium]